MMRGIVEDNILWRITVSKFVRISDDDINKMRKYIETLPDAVISKFDDAVESKNNDKIKTIRDFLKSKI